VTTTPSTAPVRRAYLAIACLLVGTVVWGFWRGYWGPLLGGGVPHFWFIHLHAAVFLGWMLLLLAQALLVTGGNVRAHRAIGTVGMGYGTLVLCVGVWISVAAPVARVHAGQLAAETAGLVALYNLTDMVVFGAFFLLAMRYRSAPALHRRLVLCSSVALTGAAVGRVQPGGSLDYALVWLAPWMAGVAVDVVADRRVHPVFLWSALAYTIIFFRVDLYAVLPGAAAIGGALVRLFL